jgi:hypothetical protein
MVKWIDIFERTLNDAQAKRPQDWFSLEYSNACRNKERCSFGVVVGEPQLEEMTPKWTAGKNNALRLNRDEKVMWSFTKSTTAEMERRFSSGKGYLYWDQFLKK